MTGKRQATVAAQPRRETSHPLGDVDRRRFLSLSVAGVLTIALPSRSLADSLADEMPIIDTHQHLWDLSWQKLPWLESAGDVLRRSYTTDDYVKATNGRSVQAIYMEVDVAPEQRESEADHVLKLCDDRDAPTVAAVIGARPAEEGFRQYLDRFRDRPRIKGVRQVLHGAGTGSGYCLQAEFVQGCKLLGERGLSFDLCMRQNELSDGAKLARACPETTFIVDHCGNADPKAFQKQAAQSDAAPAHDPEQWKRAIEELAACDNVCCKISGIVARAPAGWTASDLAPIVDHCLDAFGPDKVVFGGDWPVCLLGAKLLEWIDALGEIVASRPIDSREKLWHLNARRVYRLDA